MRRCVTMPEISATSIAKAQTPTTQRPQIGAMCSSKWKR